MQQPINTIETITYIKIWKKKKTRTNIKWNEKIFRKINELEKNS